MTDRYKGSNISPFACGPDKVCMDCMAALPEASMTLVQRTPGLTMYRCPACAAQRPTTLAAILAYAKARWCWDDRTMLEELFDTYAMSGTPEEFVDMWAHKYDLTDPRDLGINP
jgi:hypothetical protein